MLVIINKFKKYILFFILFIIYIFISATSYVSAVSDNLSNAVFRLHVLANSDSDEDQNLKLKVRDSLLKYMNSISSNCSTKEDALKIVINNKKQFQEIAEKTIQENGFNYSVNINIGNFYFPTKNYGDISLPAGFYDALRIEIGESKGKNWWCVMFPSLCFINVSSGFVDDKSKENLENNLEQESYQIISDNTSPEITFKFKLIEFFSENKFFTAKH